MRRALLGIILVAWVWRMAYSQTTDNAVVFEAASIKPSTTGTLQSAPGCSGGPGSSDPGRFTCTHAALCSIVVSAYELKPYQYSFPSWMCSMLFEVVAKVPAGATKEQFRLMQQNLLAERFKLAVHFEKREVQGYELTVGKNGPKLRESQAASESLSDTSPTWPIDFAKLQRDSNGIPIMLPRPGELTIVGTSGGPNGAGMRIQGSAVTLEQLAVRLSNLINRPITEATGLKGTYDLTLTCADPEVYGPPPSPPPPLSGAAIGQEAAPAVAAAVPTIFLALQQQLGLKLEQRKGSIDFLVLDHVERTPSEN